MSWNGSSSAGASTPAPKKPAKRSPGITHGLIAGGAIVLIGVIALYFVSGDKEEQPADKKGPTQIAEVEADISASETRTESKADVPVEVKTKPTKSFEVVNGMIMLSNGKIVPTNKIAKTHVRASDIKRAKFAIFDHSTDNEFAALLTLEPGQSLVGGPIHHMDYKKDFLKSLETPIIIKADDSEYDAELKRSVIDVRKQIKEAIDRGEDPEAIIRESYNDAQKLEMYKTEIRAQMERLAKGSEYSDQDIEDLIKASNQMLEQKGIAPMKLTPIAKARLRGDVRKYSDIIAEDIAERQEKAANLTNDDTQE